MFTQVFIDYHPKLYGYFFKKTKSEDFASDLVQLTFIKLWRFRHTLNEKISFDTQLFTIARTCFLDYLRQESIKKLRFTCLDTETLSHTAILPDDNFETADYFNQVIKTLPPVRKKVFILNRLKGLSYQEIANHLSISINTVEDHMAKAIKHIKTVTFWTIFLSCSF